MKPEEKIERAYEELRAIIDGGSESFTHDDAVKYLKDRLAQPEQERCVGCEACIDTACGRDECPKGWPKAAQPEQEPVAWRVKVETKLIDGSVTTGYQFRKEKMSKHDEPLYTTPPQRNPLPYEKVVDLWLARFDTNEYDEVFMNFARAIEAAHGIKE